MGIYLNPGNAGFTSARAGKYVDKSGLIAVVNETLGKAEKLSCISRARRFGKSYAAKMLCAYYDKSCDSRNLFNDLEIAKDPHYEEHLNKYNVIYLDITSFIGSVGLENTVSFISERVIEELTETFPDAKEQKTLVDMLAEVVGKGHAQFIAIIDEWDAPIRDRHSNREIQYEYLEFLRSLFKNSGNTDKVFAAAYMTGILPIKKDGSQSAISEFREYTMLDPGEFEPYFGFNEDEVQRLCEEENLSFDEMKRWYDGYSFKNVKSVYNPNSVMYAIRKREFKSYWQMSSSATGLLDLINMDFDGLSDAAADLIAGRTLSVETADFQNDTTSFASRDDVLTIMVHYGYLSYDQESESVRIPNEEIRREFARIIRKVKNPETLKRIMASDKLIKDTVNMDADAVAAAIEEIHRRECSPIHYNKEQSLRTVIKLGYFAYRDYYLQFEELSGGNGYADVVFVPKKNTDYPALIIELKWDKSAQTALDQIRDRHYPDVLKNYHEEILLVGISYDKEDAEKKHHCVIELLESED